MTAIRRALSQLASAARPADSNPVHFHRGPHGEPTPCFNRSCTTPKLSV